MVVIEFVDPTLSGEYRLALGPDEKDAFLHTPGAGLTAREKMGLSSKADRHLLSRTDYGSLRVRDRPFSRYETYVQVQLATPVKYRDLKGLVEIQVSFDNLPFSHRIDYFNLNKDRALVPLSVEIDNRELTFEQEASGSRARVAVYGIVTSLSNRDCRRIRSRSGSRGRTSDWSICLSKDPGSGKERKNTNWTW